MELRSRFCHRWLIVVLTCCQVISSTPSQGPLSIAQGQQGRADGSYDYYPADDDDDSQWTGTGGIIDASLDEELEPPAPGAASLAFVFDTTGSMYDDLVQVIEGAAKILTTTLAMREKPLYNYVLVPFHDPVVGPVTVTTNPELFQGVLRDLHVQGGGDCPEMSITGIQMALERSLPYSFIYVFTDARAKDFHLTDDVLSLIQHKQSQVIFVMTGDCGDVLHPGFKAYEKIASTSSGQVFLLKKSQVNKILDFVRVAVHSRKVNLLAVDRNLTSTPIGQSFFNYDLPVDSKLQEFTISVSGHNPSIVIKDPYGNTLTPENGLTTLLDLKNALIVNVKNPKPGLWGLKVTSEGQATIRVTGLSSLDFVHGFSRNSTFQLSDTSARPMKGMETFVLVNATDLDSPGRLTKLELVDLSGELLMEIPVVYDSSRPSLYNVSSFLPPTDFFYLKIVGLDDKGHIFQRTTPTAISASQPDKPLIHLPRQTRGYFEKPVLLTCQVTSLVPFELQWFHGNEQLGTSLFYSQSANVTWSINDASSLNEGLYRCSATNVAGSSIASTYVEVIDPPPVVLRPDNVSSIPGDDAILNCVARSSVQFNVTWLRHPEDPLPVDLIDRLIVFNNGSAVIRNVQKEDEGRFICRASNEGGDTEDVAWINVHSEPRVLIESETRKFSTGSRLIMRCSAVAYPRPTIVWQRHGQTVAEEDRIRIDEDTGQLSIFPATEEDEGDWVCLATNSFGRGNSSLTLSRIVAPTISVFNRTVLVSSGDSAILKCSATGIPPPNITWMRNGIQLQEISFIEILPEGVLNIIGTQEIDAGDYDCVAANEAGTAKETVRLEVGAPPLILHQPQSRSVDIHRNVTLQCSAVGRPTPKITWKRTDGIDIQLENGRIRVLENGALFIQGIEKEDEGIYSCTAENEIGKTESSAYLTVTGIVKPVIAYGNPSIDVVLGREVRLSCVILAGNPTPKISWTRFGEPVTLNDPQVIDDLNGNLILKSVRTDDEGEYVCVASNVGGNDSHSFQLDVQVPPSISNSENQLTVNEGESIRLSCEATGNPRPQIRWSKNGVRVDEFHSRYLVDETGSMTITSGDAKDSAIYSCSAVNIVGITEKRTSLFVQIPPKMQDELVELTVIVTSPIQLSCEVSGQPPPVITWTKTGQPLELDALSSQDLQLLSNGALRINRARSEDAGLYECFATSVAGNASKHVRLTVQVPPRFLERAPSTLTSTVGDEVVLPCVVIGEPEPRLTWKKNLNVIDFFSGDQRYWRNENGSMIIPTVEVDDAARYLCVAENPAGVTTQEIQLIVHEPPYFPAGIETNASIIESDRISMQCPAKGNPSPDIRWFRDGTPVTGNELGARLMPDGSLLLDHVQATEAGRYTCLAENAAGNASHDINLHVYLPPRFERHGTDGLAEPEYEKSQVIEGQPLKIQCEVSSYPTPTIVWYKNDEELTESDFRERIRVLRDGRELEIVEVEEGDAGRYTCVARNLAGEAEKITDLEVIVPPRIDQREASEGNLWVIVAHPLVINCPVLGNPMPEITWYKDGSPVDESIDRNIRIRSRGQRLEFASVDVTDVGRYECQARNLAGIASRFYNLSVLVPPKVNGSDTLTLTKDVLLNDSVTLRCAISGFPAPEVTWFHDGKVIGENSSDVYIVDGGQGLQVPRVELVHAGRYTCQAVNEAGQSKKDEILNVLVVPRINETSENLQPTTVINDTIVLSCFSGGNPDPEVEWLRNNETIDFNRHPNIQLRSSDQELVIRNAGTADSATYQCLVKNKAGLDSRDFVVEVQVPARIDRVGHDLLQTIRANHSRTLECPAFGIPPPEISWYKNGNLITPSNNQFLYFYDEGRRLEITSATVADSGIYLCRVHNDVGEDELTYEVKVIVGPEINERTSTSANPQVVINQTISIHCMARGVPPPTITWLANGQPLDRTNQRLSLSRDGRHLEIYGSEVVDTGRYTCLAKNEAGIAERHFDLEVLVPPYMNSVGLEVDVKVIKGKTIVLECPVQGIPFPNITWMKNDEPLELNARVRMMLNGRHLELSMAAEMDTANYVCVGTNPAGVATMTFNLSVYVAPKIDDANVVDNPKITVNRTILLECPVEGIPPPKVSWMKNGEVFLPRPGVRFISQGRQVEISRAQLTDTAKYTCIATNEAGEVRKDYDLEVLVPPRIEGAGKTEIIEVIEGHTTYISCSASGFPDPTVIWMKEGVPLVDGVHSNKRELSNGRQLEVRQVGPKDEGLYRCQATNVAGQRAKNYRLKVLYPPKIADSLYETDLTVVERRPTQMDCNVSGNPEPQLSWFKDGVEINSSSSSSSQVRILRGGRVMQIPSPGVEDSGLYTCKTTSVAGQAEKVYRLQVLVPPEINGSQVVEEVSVAIGSSTTLDCDLVRGSPEPVFRWMHEGSLLSLVEEPNIRVQNGGQKIDVFNVQIVDSGRYSCTASNIAGNSSKDFMLNILVPPRIEEGPTEVGAIAGSRVFLMCDTEGIPKPEVTWERDGVEIPSSGPNYMMHRSGSLHFSPVDVEDSGEYRCTATNEAGSVSRDFSLSVQVPPKIEENEQSPNKVIVGDEVELTCNVTGNPKPRITWQKGTRILSGGMPGYALMSNGSLRIESVDLRDAGVYVCIAQNSAGTALNQKRLEVQVPPIIEDQSTDYTVIEERDIILPCRVSGVPQPTVHWIRDNQTIASDDLHYRVLRTHGLAIPIVRAEDAGIFTCVAENEAGRTSVDITLDVHVPPTIEDSESLLTVNEGETAELPCVASGSPKPQIMWIQDGRTMLVTGGRYKIHDSGTLILRNVQHTDAGIYQCTAKNIAARTSKEYTLRVQVPPRITVLPREQEVTANARIELECVAEGVPTPVITWRVNNTQLPISPLSINGRSRLIISNAMKHDDGTYMCIAENPAGTSRALAAILVKVPPKVLMHSESQSVSRSEKVLLHCPVDGGADPPPTIVWMKGGQTVSLNQRIIQLANGSLIIYDASPEDAGEYKCIATNDAGSSEGTAYVTVEMQPEFVVQPESQTVEEGQTVTMDCTAIGEPTPTMSWMKDGEILRSEDRLSILPNNTLRIIAVQQHDSGSYICIARSSEGILVSADLTVLVNGHWSAWSSWTHCTVTCGHGIRLRQRKCNNPEPGNGGRPCSGPGNETKTCAPYDCPVAGGWSEWSPWEECSQSCGLGQRSRTRECNNPLPVHGGRYCSGDSTETDQCNERPCPVDGSWGGWTAWRQCSETCGSGLKERFRHCDSPRPQFGGHECVGEDFERQHCHLADCEVHGGWGSWGDWSTCSLSCGGGEHRRRRECDSPSPSNGGRFCLGPEHQIDQCNLDDCPVHSEWMDWSEWGGCTVTCGGGQRRRFRTCVDPTPTKIGRPCVGPGQETELCNVRNCAVDGEWSTWTQWSDCSKSCDGGVQDRQRTCRHPMFGGSTCPGEALETRKCNPYPCQAGFPQTSISSVVGNINNLDLGVSKFIANINRTSRGSIVTSTVTNISSVISTRLQHLVSLLHPTYWTTAAETDEAVNGYSLTKGIFRTEVHVEFATGQMLKMIHYARGLDNDGILQVDTFANGEIPTLPDGAKVVLMPYEEDYIQTGPGTIYGQSSRVVLVNGHVLPYAWNHSTSYNPEFGRMPYLVQRMVMTDIHVSLNVSQKMLGFQTTNAMAKGEPSNLCPSGFTLDQNEPYCKDVDECSHLNPCSHTCQNTPGSFMCSCPVGLSLSSDGRVCRDVDECELNVAGCHKSQECINTVGSYICLPKCESGHRRNIHSQVCDDINECAEKMGLCEQECINAPGSYMCACKQGYRLIGKSRCEDINECKEGINRCTQNGYCHNTKGGYQCSCAPGFRLDGPFTCLDVDECAESLHDCLFGQQCVNSGGGYSCISACPNGYAKSSNGSCIDIDECAMSDNLCQYNQLCVNTGGSYSCSCPRGFRSDGPNRPCLDIDECITHLQCQHDCFNTLGSFHCSCPKGYRLTGNARTCQDIDECSEMAIDCGPDKRCFNRRGDFECVDISCPVGYERNPHGGYCTAVCPTSNAACAKTQHKDILEFHLVALPSGIQAHQDLVRLLVFDQNNVHLIKSTFDLISDPSIDHDDVPFGIRSEDGKGIIYTLAKLKDRHSYQMKVEGTTYDTHARVKLYHTTFVVYISVSSFPY